jgi:hypothetical protein
MREEKQRGSLHSFENLGGRAPAVPRVALYGVRHQFADQGKALRPNEGAARLLDSKEDKEEEEEEDNSLQGFKTPYARMNLGCSSALAGFSF